MVPDWSHWPHTSAPEEPVTHTEPAAQFAAAMHVPVFALMQ